MKGLLLLISVIALASFFYFKEAGCFSSPAKLSESSTISLANDAEKKLEFNEIEKMLHAQIPALNTNKIEVIMRALKCANKNDIKHNPILTLIDYSLPSNKKRLWVFDLSENKLLFHTYISHGINSGTLLSTYFSNKFNSKASSIGVFNTEKAYRGRHGTSLKLYGLDQKFNDNAYNRFIVMHGAWYVEKWFIEKYGRLGRSWGCPAIPVNLTNSIIDTIKDGALFIVYYPSHEWFANSKFLNCGIAENQKIEDLKIEEKIPMEETPREAIGFVDINQNNKLEENEPIVAISADHYQRIFNTPIPLNRMLRRQINSQEYIALTNDEFKKMDANHDTIKFVIPVVKMQRGYYVTEMEIITLGKIKKTTLNTSGNHVLYFENKQSLKIKSTSRFIRWLGL